MHMTCRVRVKDELKILLLCLPGSEQHPDSIPEVGEDAVTSVGPAPPSTMTEEERQELQEELLKVGGSRDYKGHNSGSSLGGGHDR